MPTDDHRENVRLMRRRVYRQRAKALALVGLTVVVAVVPLAWLQFAEVPAAQETDQTGPKTLVATLKRDVSDRAEESNQFTRPVTPQPIEGEESKAHPSPTEKPLEDAFPEEAQPDLAAAVPPAEPRAEVVQEDLPESANPQIEECAPPTAPAEPELVPPMAAMRLPKPPVRTTKISLLRRTETTPGLETRLAALATRTPDRVAPAAPEPIQQVSWNPIKQIGQALLAKQARKSNPTAKIPLAGSVSPESVEVDPQSGEVSIVVRDAPLNEVLGILAREQGLNIIAAEDITASFPITLHKVPFEKALTHILAVAGYTWVRQGNILIITNISADRKTLPLAQGREVCVFPLDYVSASDIDEVIKGLLSTAGQSFITQSTSADDRKTQELVVVEDLSSYLSRIEQYICKVDQPPRQVLIEAHVLSITLQDDAKHGINFEYLDKLGIPTVTLKTQGFASAAASPAFLFNIAATDLNLLLEALETTTDAKTLATPKVLALNGQKARIQIGEQLGFRVTTTTQTSTMESVEFLDVGVVLEVTPRITRDGNVIMHVKPEVSSGEINPQTELPEEETTEVDTTLMLPDGYGMVIGGLIQETDVETQSKIPVVGDLWLVGRLFQKREMKRKRSEIIIALIPHVVPYQPARHQLECDQFQRSTTPLLYGPAITNPRPFEPRLPDAGQLLPHRYKTRHLRTVPDSGAWCPEGSQENCNPPRELIHPGQEDGTHLIETFRPRHLQGDRRETIPVPMPEPAR